MPSTCGANLYSMTDSPQHWHPPETRRFRSEAGSFLKQVPDSTGATALERIAAIARTYSRLPYENLSKLIKARDHQAADRPRLPDEVLEDHLVRQLGGTCYALTYYLMGILETAGFEAAPLICDMSWGNAAHTALRVDLPDSRYLVDPGYLVFVPVPMARQTVRRRRSTLDGIELHYDAAQDLYTLFTLRPGQRTRRYCFRDRPAELATFGRAWLASFQSPSMNGLCLTRVTPREMVYIHDDYLKITRPNGTEKARDRDRSRALIQERFGIAPEIVAAAQAALGSIRELET